MDHVQALADELVGNGYHLLTTHFDGWLGWRSKINPDTLDIEDLHQCVLGQLFGHYTSGLLELGLLAGCEHGFSPWKGVDADMLRATWVKWCGLPQASGS